MGVNKFVLNTSDGEEVKFDLTGDTVTAETLAKGVTAHDASGEQIIGTMSETGGSSGIHVGSEAPTDETVVVWIDPSADADIRSELVADVIAMLPIYGGETA